MTTVRRPDALRSSARRIVIRSLWFLPWWVGVWHVAAIATWIKTVWSSGIGPAAILTAIGVAAASIVLKRALVMARDRLAFGLAGCLLLAASAVAGAMVVLLATLPVRPDAVLVATAVGWAVLVVAGVSAVAFAVLSDRPRDER